MVTPLLLPHQGAELADLFRPSGISIDHAVVVIGHETFDRLAHHVVGAKIALRQRVTEARLPDRVSGGQVRDSVLLGETASPRTLTCSGIPGDEVDTHAASIQIR